MHEDVRPRDVSYQAKDGCLGRPALPTAQRFVSAASMG